MSEWIGVCVGVVLTGVLSAFCVGAAWATVEIQLPEPPPSEVFWGTIDLNGHGGTVGYSSADGTCVLSYPVEEVARRAGCPDCSASYTVDLGASGARQCGSETVFQQLDGLALRLGVGAGALYMDTGAGWEAVPYSAASVESSSLLFLVDLGQ